MPNAIDVVKRAALDAMDASKPVNVIFGTVISTTPLKIQVDQKTIYTSKMLILARNVTDYDVDMTVEHQTDSTSGGSGDLSFASHAHGYTGRKQFCIHNALCIGDKVILLRIQQGKKFLVWDRVG